jgi:hypothetical protein
VTESKEEKEDGVVKEMIIESTELIEGRRMKDRIEGK